MKISTSTFVSLLFLFVTFATADELHPPHNSVRGLKVGREVTLEEENAQSHRLLTKKKKKRSKRFDEDAAQMAINHYLFEVSYFEVKGEEDRFRAAMDNLVTNDFKSTAFDAGRNIFVEGFIMARAEDGCYESATRNAGLNVVWEPGVAHNEWLAYTPLRAVLAKCSGSVFAADAMILFTVRKADKKWRVAKVEELWSYPKGAGGG